MSNIFTVLYRLTEFTEQLENYILTGDGQIATFSVCIRT